MLKVAHFGLLLLPVVWILGCAEATPSVGSDLSGGNDLSAVEPDAGEDMAVEQPDLTIVCDAGAGLRVCKDKCVTDTQCCENSECPTPAHGAPLCNNLNQCDVTCDTNYKACNNTCIPMTDCCSDADCSTPGDPCKLAQGAKCETGVCNYPAVQCPYEGQFCNGSGACVCPGLQHPCVSVGAGGPQGKCIPDGTCCSNSDCSAINLQVCPGPGGTCTCTAGMKTCAAGATCIPDGTCCPTDTCPIGGQTCSGVGGSCNCPSMQKSCGATCIPIANCCVDADCNAVNGRICQAGSCQCPTGQKACFPGTGAPTCIPNATCCGDSDCASPTNSTCSGPGGTCGCPAATRYLCGSACILNNTCCTSADCFRIRGITGESCSGAGGTCSCPAGTAECSATGTCVSTAAGRCCTSSSCAAGGVNHVTSANCNSTFCGVNSCSSGWVDVNGSWSDGCECQDDGFGKDCSSRTAVGPIAISGGTSLTGKLPIAGQRNWFAVTFTGNTGSTSYHPHITITSPDDIRFNIHTSTSCSAPNLGCGIEGGSATAKKD